MLFRSIGDHLRDEESIAAPKRMEYVAAGAIPALVAAGTTHRHHASVAENVCRAFINIFYEDDDKVNPEGWGCGCVGAGALPHHWWEL